PSGVKVVLARGGAALYCSRAPVRFDRDGASQGVASQRGVSGAYRHLGVYAYRVSAVERRSALPPSELERIDKLEQLRALQAGMRIVVAVAEAPPPAGVDTPEAPERVRAALTST